MDVYSTARRASRSRYATPHANTMGEHANPVASAPVTTSAGDAMNRGDEYRKVDSAAPAPHVTSTTRTRLAFQPITERQHSAHTMNAIIAVADEATCTSEMARPLPPTMSRELKDRNTQAQ